MSAWDCALRLLPSELKEAAERLPAAERDAAEEFRLRRDRPPGLRIGPEERLLRRAPVTGEELRGALERAARGSLHAVREELRRGYLTAEGGARVGVCGAFSGGAADPEALSSLCIRIPRQVPGAGAALLPELRGQSVLILSPPGGGKTTFLRELVRCCGDAGERVGLVDERGEVAALWHGAPQLSVGRCTDVLSGVPKAEGAMMLLRTMGPELIALDEISAPADLEAVLAVAGCGVRVVATVHAASTEELRRAERFKPLLRAGVFGRAVTISGAGAGRRYRAERL